MDDKSWLVFDFLHIVHEGLAQKALNASLKLLPSLLRCLLIHSYYLPFLNEDKNTLTIVHNRGLSLMPTCPLAVYPLTRFHQSPILQNDRVNNLSTDQTLPSPKLLIGTIKFVIDHGAVAARTFRNMQCIH